MGEDNQTHDEVRLGEGAPVIGCATVLPPTDGESVNPQPIAPIGERTDRRGREEDRNIDRLDYRQPQAPFAVRDRKAREGSEGMCGR